MLRFFFFNSQEISQKIVVKIISQTNHNYIAELLPHYIRMVPQLFQSCVGRCRSHLDSLLPQVPSSRGTLQWTTDRDSCLYIRPTEQRSLLSASFVLDISSIFFPKVSNPSSVVNLAGLKYSYKHTY